MTTELYLALIYLSKTTVLSENQTPRNNSFSFSHVDISTMLIEIVAPF